MLTPVIAVFPSSEAMQNSAAADVTTLDVQNVEVPDGLVLDPNFAAIPLGGGTSDSMTSEAMTPAGSTLFAVRGFVDADPDEGPPQTMGQATIYADPQIEVYLTCGGTPPVGTAQDVATNLGVASLAAKGLTGANVGIVIMDTGINLAHLSNVMGSTPNLDVANSFTPPGSTTAPGRYKVHHGTMCAFDALIAAPSATLIDYPILAVASAGGSTISGTLSLALLAFARVLGSWGVAFAAGGLSQYAGLVVSNSWGIFNPNWDFPVNHPGRYCDNPNHPFNLLLGVMAQSGIDVVFAAGNCGADCADLRCAGRTTEAIMGASAMQPVLTLAGCDNTAVRVGYSSQGPSIANMFQEKPDITAYTHFAGSRAFGPNSPDSGTSAACPVAAGCVAALRTSLAPRDAASTPAVLFDKLRSTAGQGGGLPAGWNGDYGFGIIDPGATATAFGL